MASDFFSIFFLRRWMCYSCDSSLCISKTETFRFRKEDRKVNGHDHWDNSPFFWLEKDETGVASKQMSWTFIKQVCLGNEDEQVDRHAFLSLGVSQMLRTRSKCRERKTGPHFKSQKKETGLYLECSREQCRLRICELEARKGADCVLFGKFFKPLFKTKSLCPRAAGAASY